MRILSQDKISDYPYDGIGLSIGWREDKEEYYIFWNSIQRRMSAKIAIYSSFEKAKKAMEMLHDAYMGYVIYKIMSEQQKALLFASTSKKEQKNLCGMFQFPADDELEG